MQRRLGTVALVDILKETVLRTGCLAEVSSVAGSGTMPVEVLAERLMLAIYAYGNNTGIRAVVTGILRGWLVGPAAGFSLAYLTTLAIAAASARNVLLAA